MSKETVNITYITEEGLGGKITIAILNDETLLGKHYHNGGLSWNMPSMVRYTATLEEWKANVEEYKFVK